MPQRVSDGVSETSRLLINEHTVSTKNPESLSLCQRCASAGARVFKGVGLAVGAGLALAGYSLYTAGRAIAYIPFRLAGTKLDVTGPAKQVASDILENARFLYYGNEVANPINKNEPDHVVNISQAHMASTGEAVTEKVVYPKSLFVGTDEKPQYNGSVTSEYEPVWVNCDYTRDTLKVKKPQSSDQDQVSAIKETIDEQETKIKSLEIQIRSCEKKIKTGGVNLNELSILRESLNNAFAERNKKLQSYMGSVTEWQGELKSVVPNLALHQVKTGEDSKYQAPRCGAITDARFGYYSQKDLDECLAADGTFCVKKLAVLIQKLDKQLHSSKMAKAKDPLMAKAYLECSRAKLMDVWNQISVDSREEIWLRGESNRPPQSNPSEKLKEFSKARKDWCDKQFVQCLAWRLKNGQKITNGKFNMSSLTLIHDKPKIEDAGLIHDERVIKDDKSATYERFHGCEVSYGDKFDVTYDDTGKPTQITLPEAEYKLSGDDQSFKLTTACFNISIQKDTKNTEEQKALNLASLNRFFGYDQKTTQKEFLKEHKEYSFLFTKSFLREADCLKLLELLRKESPEAEIEIGCYSGKDRTGLICAEDAKATVEEKMGASIPTMGGIGPNSLAVAVVEHNTKKGHLKLEPFGLSSWSHTADLVYAYLLAKWKGKAGGAA